MSFWRSNFLSPLQKCWTQHSVCLVFQLIKKKDFYISRYAFIWITHTHRQVIFFCCWTDWIKTMLSIFNVDCDEREWEIDRKRERKKRKSVSVEECFSKNAMKKKKIKWKILWTDYHVPFEKWTTKRNKKIYKIKSIWNLCKIIHLLWTTRSYILSKPPSPSPLILQKTIAFPSKPPFYSIQRTPRPDDLERIYQ